MSISRTPRLVGVIDLMGGVAVRAVGGRRDEYRPVESRLCGSSDPRKIAAAFNDRYGIGELYVADLDAIRTGRSGNGPRVAGLAADGFRVTLDAGLHSAADVSRWTHLGVDTFVAALETLAGPDVLTELVALLGPARLAFGLDLANDVPLADPAVWGESTWSGDSPLRLARRAAEAGLTKLIVLDLRTVGTGNGPTTAELCRRIKEHLPHIGLRTGGGVRTAADVQTLVDAGAEGVLVASALHDEAL